MIPGISNSNSVEIKSGLKEGDTVYYTEEQNMFGNRGFGNMPGGQMPGGDRSNNGGFRNNGGGMPGQMPGNRG